jgi:hypothetical protein
MAANVEVVDVFGCEHEFLLSVQSIAVTRRRVLICELVKPGLAHGLLSLIPGGDLGPFLVATE